MAAVTLAPTDRWQQAFRAHDGVGRISLIGGADYNAVGGITFNAPRVDIGYIGDTPPTIRGSWSTNNTAVMLRGLNYVPPPGEKLFYVRYGGLDLVDPQVILPPEYPQIDMLISINKAGFDITASARDALFSVGDRIKTQVFDIDSCKFKFAASSTTARIRTEMSNKAIGMVFDASDGKASGLQFIGQGRNGAGIEARRGSRLTLSGDVRTAGLDIGMRARHDSSIFIEAGTIEDCYQGLREEGGRIRPFPAVVFRNNATDRIAIPVGA